MIVFLNTAILTAHGKYEYTPITIEEIKTLLKDSDFDFESAIGHVATAQVMSSVLQIPIKVNRIEFKQQKEDIAIVFKLRGRAPEGTILDKAQLEVIGYDFGKIVKL